ncbi:hypothetical protein V6N11_014120 [Hibiscus sabdariffa]|uniref:ATP synthase protein MI25 n=1 Tax=Hibiscus sabdariffa TaxID=183260 RepID=A0ABR2AGC1_9ROSI
MIVARCFIGFIIFSRKSLGKTFKVTLDGRIQAIQEESQQFPNPNEVVLLESNEQQRLLRISLRICGTVVESLPMARCAPKCEKTVQALLCRNLNVKSATLPNATSSHRIRLQDDLVTKFHILVGKAFSCSSYEELKAHGTAYHGLEKRYIVLIQLIMRLAKRPQGTGHRNSVCEVSALALRDSFFTTILHDIDPCLLS